MKSVIVGYGNAAKIHEQWYPEYVDIIGIVDISPTKLKVGGEKGYEVFDSLESAINTIGPETDFWDICTPTNNHYSATKMLLENLENPDILIEKPVCDPKEIPAIMDLILKHPDAKVAVNENYLSSGVNIEVKKILGKYEIKHPDISIEFSKNRIQDVLDGRFLDQELGAFGYEGPHMMTCIQAILGDISPEDMVFAETGDMDLPAGKTRDKQSVLKSQGYGEIKFHTKDGSTVDFYTSMDGKLKHTFPEIIRSTQIPVEDTKTRYRIMNVRGNNDLQIIAQYEPIGDTRNLGRILIKDKSTVLDDYCVPDNSMRSHLEAVINYFGDRRENPSPVEKAAHIVDILSKAANTSY